MKNKKKTILFANDVRDVIKVTRDFETFSKSRDICPKVKKKSLGSGVKIRVGRVTGNTQYFFRPYLIVLIYRTVMTQISFV